MTPKIKQKYVTIENDIKHTHIHNITCVINTFPNNVTEAF